MDRYDGLLAVNVKTFVENGLRSTKNASTWYDEQSLANKQIELVSITISLPQSHPPPPPSLTVLLPTIIISNIYVIAVGRLNFIFMARMAGYVIDKLA